MFNEPRNFSLPSLDEIKNQLTDVKGDLGLRIVRSLGTRTSPLFAVFHSKGTDQLELAGTGTFVVLEGRYGILTAAHVWEKVLKGAVKLGIALTEEIDQRFLIDISTIAPTILKAAEWTEEGPDLAFLRIPNERVGAIQAFKSYEHLNEPPKKSGQQLQVLECWFSMGTPKELGAFTQSHASVAVRGDMVSPEYVSGDLDYYDFEIDTSSPGDPKSFGGASGGGLWQVYVYPSPATGKVDWAARLKGVMFWQFDSAGGQLAIRCHGPNSIVSLLKIIE
jgi:hypothetical protein